MTGTIPPEGAHSDVPPNMPDPIPVATALPQRPPLSGSRLQKILRLEQDRFDSARMRSGYWGPFAVVDALLKESGAVFRQVVAGQDSGLYARSILIVSIFFTALYGLLMGMPASMKQGAYASAKLPLVFIGTWLICLPSFYVFNSMMGSKLTLRQTCLLLLCLTGPAAILLIGFAPVVWFFGISTESGGFIAFMHVAVIGLATMYGIASLGTARDYVAYLGDDSGAVGSSFVALWTLVYTAVLCQMCTYLGPLVTTGNFFTGKRQLFLAAMVEFLTGK